MKHSIKRLQLLLSQETACTCVLAKILKFSFNLEMILAQSTQVPHLYTDNAHANFIPLTQPLGCAVDTTVCRMDL